MTGPGSHHAAPVARRAVAIEALFATVFFAALAALVYLSALGDRLLVKGDDLLYHWVFFATPSRLWDPYILAGFPTASDPQTMTWYPVSWLLKAAGSWNAFALAPFVLAGCFTYGYVYDVTRSRLAACVSGTSFAFGGFMTGHFGHTAIEHGAAWLPLLVWSAESLAHHGRAWWVGIGAVGVAACGLAGHPQIFLYACGTGAAYTLWRATTAPVGWRRYLVLFGGMLALGVGLASVQLLLTSELAAASVRAEATYERFTGFSWPVRQWRMVFSPFLYGGAIDDRYRGQPFMSEYVAYHPSVVMMLAAAGLLGAAGSHKRLRVFFGALAAVSLLLCLGSNLSPLARLVYRIPLLGLFQAPSRHLMEYSFAVSVLAGLTLAGLREEARAGRTSLRLAAAIVLLALLPSLAALTAGESNVASGHVVPLSAPPVLIFCVLALMGGGVLLAWLRRRESRALIVLLGTLVGVEVAAFAVLMHWPHRFTPRTVLAAPPVAKYAPILGRSQQRVIQAGEGGLAGLPGNLSSVWRLPSVGGYGPLLPARLAQLLRIVEGGGRADTLTYGRRNQALDILAVRYYFGSTRPNGALREGVSWLSPPQGIQLGGPPPRRNPTAVEFQIPDDFAATSIAVVSTLGDAAQLEEGQVIARFLATSVTGEVEVVPMLVGRDTSEWSHDAPSLRASIRHPRAKVFESSPMEGGKWNSHQYVAVLPLKRPGLLNSLVLEHQGPRRTVLAVGGVSLVGGPDSVPLTPTLDPMRWTRVETLGTQVVWENTRARPRAWTVQSVHRMSAKEVLRTIHTSRMPDGSAFDARTAALVEESAPSGPFAADARVTLAAVGDTSADMDVVSSGEAFVVLSDVAYPGWSATIDGAPAEWYRTNYLLRGVTVPAGTHRLAMRYRPRRLVVGGVLSLASLAVAGVLSLTLHRRREAGLG